MAVFCNALEIYVMQINGQMSSISASQHMFQVSQDIWEKYHLLHDNVTSLFLL